MLEKARFDGDGKQKQDLIDFVRDIYVTSAPEYSYG